MAWNDEFGLRLQEDGENESNIVIFPNDSYQTAVVANTMNPPPIKNRFDLSSDLWIGPLEKEDAKVILEACTPPGYNPKNPSCSQLYAFVRENPPPPNNQKAWDELLLRCIALSRIAHPTSISYKYSATIARNSKGELLTALFVA
jgi:hypothetical protein